MPRYIGKTLEGRIICSGFAVEAKFIADHYLRYALDAELKNAMALIRETAYEGKYAMTYTVRPTTKVSPTELMEALVQEGFCVNEVRYGELEIKWDNPGRINYDGTK